MWQGPRLLFSVTPSSTGTSGTALATQPVVALTNPKGTVITTMPKSVTLAAYTDNRCTNVAGGAVSATTNPVSTSSGTATFAGVTYPASGTIYLRASAQGVRSACWGPIAVTSSGGGGGGSNPTPYYPYPAGLRISGSSEIGTNSCTAYVISSVDQYTNPSKVTSATTISLSGAGSGAFYSDSGCGTTTTTATIASGNYQTTVYYKGPSAQTNILTVRDSGMNLSSGSQSVTLVSKKLTLSGPQSMLPSTCGATAFQINYLNGDGTQAGSSISVTINGYQAGVSAGASVIYTANSCSNGVKISGTGPVTVTGTAPYLFYYKSANVTGTLTFEVSGTGVNPATLTVNVLSALPTKLALSGSKTPVLGKCHEYTVNSQNASSVNAEVSSNTTVTITQSGSAQIYSDPFCISTASSVVIPGGGTSAKFYLKDSTNESLTLTTQATGLTQANLNLVVGSGGTPQVESGESHTCALLSDQTVKCWGSNSAGQLGNGSTISSRTPVAVSLLSGVTALSSGDRHACALLSDQTVKCWGENVAGQLGNGTTTNSSVPVAVSSLTGVTAVSAGESFTCALLSDQTVKCWGQNYYNELGNGTTTASSTPVAVSSLTGVTAISAGGLHACALLSNQTLKCWGYNQQGQQGNGSINFSNPTPSAVPSLTSVTAVTTGDSHTCALFSDQTAKCWGYNGYGQLGDGSTTNSSTPVAVSSLTGAISISGGENHTCALLSAQTVKCWGRNQYGQLGNGSTTDSSAPVAVSSLTSVTAITVGASHTCALLSDQTIKCWGDNNSGQLGNGIRTNPNYPVAVPSLTGITAITAGEKHACALFSDQTVKCWGENASGQLGNGSTTASTSPVAVSSLTGVTAIKAGRNFTCALLSDQTVKCWGSMVFSNTPVTINSLTGAMTIAAGSNFTCALLSDQTVKCWGGNGSGQLGNGTTSSSAMTAISVSSLTGVTSLFVGYGNTHACAVLSDQTVKCWGYNFYGQLGNGLTTNSTTPVAVSSLSGATAVAANERSTCALLSDQTVKCWGNNLFGQLGNGSTTDSLTPVAVSSVASAASLATGTLTYFALLSDQSVMAWGANVNGELGTGAVGAVNPTAASIPFLVGVTSVTSGLDFTCALLSDQTVKCWGNNDSSQLGFNTTTPGYVLYIPVR